ncbi:MAG TPA: type II secretion system F family protein [Phycisphaerae bacterium]|jgi:general secretion pathway protein F/type IV pilus assembly protein PilC
MATFTYKAVGTGGQAVSGTLTAENQQVALRMLDERALYPVAIEEGGEATRRLIGGRRRVRLRYLTTFYNQLGDLLRAGVPMLRSLDVLIKQCPNPLLAEILREVRDDVSGGATLADAMGKHHNAFSELHVSMIRAGERGGFLEDVLARIAGFAERQDELRNKLIGSMIYPCVLMVVGTTIVTLLLTLVVPKLRRYLKEETFNSLTWLVFGAADFLQAYYLPILLGAGLIFISIYSYAKTETGRRAIAMWKLKAPVVGGLVTLVALCRFCRILGTLLKNGVPILQSLKIAKDAAGNAILADEIEKAHENVKRGETLSRPLANCGLFPADIIDMIAVAEESNNLDAVLIQIADSNEARTARQIDLAVRMLEPVLLLIMAVVVLVIAMALLLPILNMSSAAMGR